MKRLLLPCTASLALTYAAIASDQETLTGEAYFKSFGADPATTDILSVELSPGLFGLRGVGGNILASIGPQGTLLVDDQFEASVPKIRAVVKELGGDSIDFVVNTHWHFDHADGNLPLAESGSWIVAHESTRELMKSPQSINLVDVRVTQDAYPEGALPVITFTDRLRFHFNGHTVDLLHFGPAHTSSDVAVLFREANVVHMGDIYNGAYPLIDVDSGGSLAGIIEFCEKVLAEMDPEGVVVPGHGRPTDRQAFEDYVAMLRTIHDRIETLVRAGATLDAVMNAGIAGEWEEVRGNPTRLLNRAYHAMKREIAPQ